MATGEHRPLVEQSIVPVVSDVADAISNRLILRALLLRPRAAAGKGAAAAAPPAPPTSDDAGAVHASPDGIQAEFKGWARVPWRWPDWVAKLHPRHAPLWKQLGILDGVLASTYRVRRERGLLEQLAAFWSEPTGTFVFPWGEATLTLNDAVLLAGLPLLGVPVRAPVSDDRSLEKDVAAIEAVRQVLNRSKKKKPAYAAWVQHFVDRAPEEEEEEAAAAGGDGEDLDVEHGAFLAMWLSLFVLPGHPFDVVRREVLPLAARLARGQKVALAPAALAAIYGDLAALRRRMTTTSGEEKEPALVVSAPMHILQLWAWEHFPQLRPEPVGSSSAPADQDDMSLPRGARWHNEAGRNLSSEEVRAVFMSPEEFLWRPYGNRTLIGLQPEKAGDFWFSVTSEMLMSLKRCLRPCELVGMDCIQPYRPHRVARQLGFDQDIPGMVPRASASSSAGWERAWETYNVGEKAGGSVIMFPKHTPCVTVEYAKWWMTHASSACGGVSGGNGNAAEMEEAEVHGFVSAAKRKTDGAVAGGSGKKMKEAAASANAAEMKEEVHGFVSVAKRKMDGAVAGDSGKKMKEAAASANAAEMEEVHGFVSAAKRKRDGAVAGDSGKKMKEAAVSANAAEMEAEGNNDFVGPEKRKMEEVVLAGNSGKKLHLPVATATRGRTRNVPAGPSHQSSSRLATMSTTGMPQPAPDAADDDEPLDYISLSEKLNRITKMAKQPKPNTETKGRCDKSSTKGHEVRLKSHMSGANKSLIRERDEDTKLDDARNDEVQVLETVTKPPGYIIEIIDDELDEETSKEAGVFVEASKEDDIIHISDDEPEQ